MTEATGTITTIYSGNYIYQNNALQMINQPEGYLEPNGQGGYDYGYRLKVGAQRACIPLVRGKSRLCGNHLGNIRLTFVDFDHNGSIALSEITEENNYYPFGLKHQGYNNIVNSNTNAVASKFKYNGKELNDELGLDLYDYGARFYDAALGRWHVIDPLEQYFSPYVYVGNNPILMNDPSGMWGEDPNQNHEKSVVDPNGQIIFWDPNSSDKNIYLSPDGIKGSNGNTAGLEDVGDEDPNVDYSVGKYWHGMYQGYTNTTSWYPPGFNTSGRIDTDATIESFFIPIFGFFKYIKIGKLVYKVVPNGAGKYVLKLVGLSDDAAKGGIQLTKKTFGHTFTTHGDDMTNFLLNRAKGSGMAQGQFLNNQKAAQFILDNVGKTANGAVNIPIPKGFPARVIMSD